MEREGKYDVKFGFHEQLSAANRNGSYIRYRVISKAEAMERLSNKLDLARRQAALKNVSIEEIAANRRRAIEEEGRSVSDSELNSVIDALKRMNK